MEKIEPRAKHDRNTLYCARVGGAPPKEVEMALCDIGTVFAKLSEIKSN